MRASASLLLFGDEQICFPGIHPCPAELRADPGAESPPAGPGVSQCPGQLCFGPSQMLLDDADPDPRQPSLLPEPPPWDLVERPTAPTAPRPDRAARTGQEALFPTTGTLPAPSGANSAHLTKRRGHSLRAPPGADGWDMT